MAGLLDQGGLLGNQDALLALAAGLLSGKKGQTGSTIGESLMGALRAGTLAEENRRRNAMLDQQLAQGKITLEQAQQAQNDDRVMRQILSGNAPQQVPPGFQGPPAPPQPPGGMQAPPSAPTDGMQAPPIMPGPKNAQMVMPQGQPTRKQIAESYIAKAQQLEMSGGSPSSAAALRKAAMDMMPQLKDTKTQVDPRTGQRVTVNFYNDGTTEVVPFAPDQEKAHFADTGGAVLPLDPFTGLPRGQAIGKTISPDSALSAQTTMRGQNMTDSRDRARLAFDTGLNASQYGFQNPQIPGVNTSGMAPAQAAQVAVDVGKKRGEAVQQAQIDLPNVAAQTQNTIGLVDKLLKHPGFETSVGMKGPTGAAAALGYPIPGTEAADWKAMRDQLVGQQFMQAYNTLKGGGQITEVEGKKATDAISRMTTAQSEKAFREAADEFKTVMNNGLTRLRMRASGTIGTPGQWSIRPLQ